ncbi:MAG: hypothetical protein WDO71_21785 [Bacteroidota bacterium]
MKKKEKYYPVNKQEDEDGYSLHHGNTITTKISKAKQKVSSRNTITNAGPGSAPLQFRNLLFRLR